MKRVGRSQHGVGGAAPGLGLLLAGAMSLLPAMALLPATAAARTPARHTAERVITKGPRAWALATTALLAYRNHDRIDMLPPNARTDSSVLRTRGILRNWWGIDNRADLLQVLEHLDRGGHRVEFQRQSQALLAMTSAQYKATLSAARNRPDDVRAMELARAHYRKHRRNSYVGWDYCRYIMLCRWGYLVGLLTEEEAWRRIMPAARTIQAGFRSWEELGEDYLVGRQLWSREETQKTGKIYRDIDAWLLKEPRSAWNTLPWRMNLGPSAAAR